MPFASTNFPFVVDDWIAMLWHDGFLFQVLLVNHTYMHSMANAGSKSKFGANSQRC